jgi:hypothetical protein
MKVKDPIEYIAKLEAHNQKNGLSVLKSKKLVTVQGDRMVISGHVSDIAKHMQSLGRTPTTPRGIDKILNSPWYNDIFFAVTADAEGNLRTDNNVANEWYARRVQYGVKHSASLFYEELHERQTESSLFYRLWMRYLTESDVKPGDKITINGNLVHKDGITLGKYTQHLSYCNQRFEMVVGERVYSIRCSTNDKIRALAQLCAKEPMVTVTGTVTFAYDGFVSLKRVSVRGKLMNLVHELFAD